MNFDIWSGTAGSLASAAIGALVALLVVWRTNFQQRAEASRGRQTAAIADMISALDEALRTAESSGKQYDVSIRALQSATARLFMEMPRGGVVREALGRYPMFIERLVARSGASPDLDEVVSSFRHNLMNLPGAKKDEQDDIATKLEELRRHIEAKWR